LVVDDDASAARSISLLLADDYQVTRCDSGTAALALMGQQNFDVASIDFQMPGMSGAELLTEIRKRDDPCACILVTCAPDRALDTMLARNSDLCAVMSKPVDAKSFLDLVERLGRLVQTRRGLRLALR
jgi:DNA-binding response OmpR family regulator